MIILQEIFGINADMKETCEELAGRGFIAICPDLFWRQEPGLELSSWSEAEWEKGLALYAAYDFDAGVSDIAAVIAYARVLAGASGKVGVMGFCLGGLMTFLTAARAQVDCAVAYYGGGTEKYLSEGDGVAAPLLMHLAEEDEFISKEAQARIEAALADKPNVEIHSYAGCNHAFARHSGTHFDAQAADLANNRTWAFFDRHLR
ncbi:carboxymethylenebutenolidase [Sphingomonas oleivorans]|uniref:Carboxymethylenebutenolidase n=1 Tax=Sphingomonas oleivorans TaxID=1735121 RepID=A0A2T5FZB6_9SPHN|nr:carboxymethylenebutenolidase [Sphingomonas oleivorans]